MKVLGQGIKDLGERFFHGMYTSAYGNPNYGNTLPTETVVDNSALLQTGVIEISIFLAFVLVAVLSLLAILHIQQHRTLGIKAAQLS